MADIVALGKARVDDDRKRAFLYVLAAAYDDYVNGQGQVPDAIAFVLGGLKQAGQPSYMVNGDSRGGSTTWLTFASACLMREAMNGDD